MERLEFAECLGRFRSPEHIAKNFIFSASPVLAGIKPAALLSLQSACLDAWKRKKRSLCEDTGLSAIEICRGTTAFTLLLYDAGSLSRTLHDPMARRLLKKYGYPVDTGIAKQLSHLKSRFHARCVSSDGAQTFPHEIGIFLGYPPADVAAFIKTGGEGCLCCRYWKVYQNVPAATETFRKMDAVRMRAAKLVETGRPIRTTVKLISQLQVS